MFSSADGASVITVPMEQEYNWLFLGAAGIGIIVIILGILLLWRRTHTSSHGKGGGL
jgi:hypothetical protein